MASLVVSDPKLTLASDGKFLPEIVSGGRLCSAKASARRDVDVDPELTPPRGEKFFPGIVSGDRYDCCPGTRRGFPIPEWEFQVGGCQTGTSSPRAPMISPPDRNGHQPSDTNDQK